MPFVSMSSLGLTALLFTSPNAAGESASPSPGDPDAHNHASEAVYGHARSDPRPAESYDLHVDITLDERDPLEDFELDCRVHGWHRYDPYERDALRRLCVDHDPATRPALCEAFVDPDADPAKTWAEDGGYFMLGLAPAASFVPGAFHPQLRYDMETGMIFRHARKDRSVTVGVDAQLFNLFDRRRPGGGVDVVVSGQMGPVYLRGGLGVLGGLPYGPDSHATRPAVGGLVGIGLQAGSGDLSGRIGVDYDLRVDRGLGLIHTVLLSVRFGWGL